ncbi:MAG: bifunctional homocysteine S-methyltransferase/methylenetetrahydrofolate reductase [Pseudomonadota bacterium]
MTDRLTFLECLERRRVLLFDGAIGTMLYAKGVYINQCYDSLNLHGAKLVREVHQEYADAGADVVETNTFGANRVKLRSHGFAGELEAINRAGVALAREAAGRDVYVAGAIGPLGLKIEPWGPTSVEEAREIFREQAAALAAEGVDLFILETFGDLNEIHQALSAVRAVSDLPVVAQMTLQEDGNSLYGTPPELFTRRLEEWGADVIGVNCSVGPKVAFEAAERILQTTSLPVAAQPNAGSPQNVEGRNIYLASPEYFEEFTKRFVQAGVRVVGGCCGTTPDHVRAMRKAVLATTPESRLRGRAGTPVSVVETPQEVRPEVPLAERSPLARKIANREFVVSVELVPPRGVRVERIIERARRLKEAGVDVINIPDGPRATARVGPLAMALHIQQEVGVETLLHYTCRDRNLLGMQSDLLGAHVLGLRNMLLVTGDPPKMGDYPDATAVFDVDAIGLVNIVTRLNRGLDVGGNDIQGTTEFLIGVGVNPGAINLEQELNRFYWKVDAGAHFAVTQPVFDVSLLEAFLETVERRKMRIPILAGIWPLVSYRNAQFMNNEVPGAQVPADIMERMREAEAGDRARAEGIAVAREVYQRVRPLIDGVQLAAPGGRVESALSIIADGS